MIVFWNEYSHLQYINKYVRVNEILVANDTQ